jgi:hypothetical protein
MEVFDNWYIYGEYVIDKILGTARSEVVNVYSPLPPLSPEIVRRSLHVPRTLTIEITTTEPRSICTLDEIVLLPGGELYERGTNSTYTGDNLILELVGYDLTADDILRLYRLYLDFPEIEFEPALTAYLHASFTFLQSLRHRFEGLELAFLRHTPFTRWRTDSMSAWNRSRD